MFNIDYHEKEILAAGYKNNTIQVEDKWIQLNILNIQPLLWTNHYMPLSHMAKIIFCLKKKINVLMSSLLYIRLIKI